jgi:hypothetical protein
MLQAFFNRQIKALPATTQCPHNHVGKHHHEDVALSALFGLHIHGSHFQKIVFECAEIPFNLCQILIPIIDDVGISCLFLLFRKICLDDIAPIKTWYFIEGLIIYFQFQGSLLGYNPQPFVNFKVNDFFGNLLCGCLYLGSCMVTEIYVFLLNKPFHTGALRGS